MLNYLTLFKNYTGIHLKKTCCFNLSDEFYKGFKNNKKGSWIIFYD